MKNLNAYGLCWLLVASYFISSSIGKLSWYFAIHGNKTRGEYVKQKKKQNKKEK